MSTPDKPTGRQARQNSAGHHANAPAAGVPTSGRYAFDSKEDRINAAALLNFFGITDEWQCAPRDQMTLLGNPSKSSFYRMRDFADGKADKPPRLGHDTLERISYLMGIYKALNILLPSDRRAAEWVRRPNSYPLFAGKSALDIMLQGRVIDLADVRRYLDGERGL
ncbi:MAG: MbcA/ParS/Xre antitoxin family protein [Ketobacteraceae bacterium]|nr:MbcA/ParS/Xre antitoxin family protein [Ketobacteraceae bacterium]